MSNTTNNFKQQLEELEHIIEWFESEDVDIDQALEKFRRGMELVSNLESWLEEAENTVQEITDAANRVEAEEPPDSDEETA